MPGGKDLVRDALNGIATSRPPFVPLVGAFAAKHLQVPVRAFYTDPGTLAKGLEMARSLTRADAIVCLPDETLLPEACGCPVAWDAAGPELRSAPPGAAASLDADVVLQGARVPILFDALTRLRHALDQEWGLLTALTGPYALARRLWPGNFEQALAGSDPEARELLEGAGTLCTQMAHRLGELELDGCLIMDGVFGPDLETAPFAAPVYETMVNALAFYDCAAIYNGTDLDWLETQAVRPGFKAFLPVAGSAGTTQGDSGPIPLCAALSEEVLLAEPGEVQASVDTCLEAGPVLISTAREVPAETPLPSLQAVAAALP